jgi:hypothetical protein
MWSRELIQGPIGLCYSDLADWILPRCLHRHLCSGDPIGSRSNHSRTTPSARLQHEHLQLCHPAHLVYSRVLGEYGGLAPLAYQLSFYLWTKPKNLPQLSTVCRGKCQGSICIHLLNTFSLVASLLHAPADVDCHVYWRFSVLGTRHLVSNVPLDLGAYHTGNLTLSFSNLLPLCPPMARYHSRKCSNKTNSMSLSAQQTFFFFHW